MLQLLAPHSSPHSRLLTQHRDLSENKLTSVPACIGRLASLGRLDLHSNSIEQLPDEISELDKVGRFVCAVLLQARPAAVGSRGMAEAALCQCPFAEGPPLSAC